MFSYVLKLLCLCVLSVYSVYAYSEVHQLAFSKKMGVTVFAEAAPDWCKEEVRLIVETKNDDFFVSSDFEKLIGVIGEKVFPKECSSASKAIVTGKYDQKILWQGYADKISGWKVVSHSQKHSEFSQILEGSARSLCSGLPVECTNALSASVKAWFNEVLKQSMETQSARRKFSMLFSNPGALADDTIRLEHFEEAIKSKEFAGELSAKLNNEFLARENIGLPKMDAKAAKNIASDIAINIITDLAIESLSQYYEQSGDKEKTYWISTAVKPSIEIGALAKGLAAGTTTASGSTVGAGLIWGKNVYSFTLLGAHLNEDDATGRDVHSKLAMLAEQNVSIVESLMSGETQGVLYRGYKTRKLTQKEVDALQDMLIINNEHQSELLKQKAMYDEFAWVVNGAKKFAKFVASIDAGATYSGLEHANSTPSLPKDVTQLAAKIDTPIDKKEEQDRQSEGNLFQLKDAVKPTKVIGEYKYISDVSSGRKPKYLMGTITLTDVGLTLNGKTLKPKLNQTKARLHTSSVFFYDINEQVRKRRRNPEEVVVKALTYTNATWGTKHEIVTFSPLWARRHNTPLKFQTKIERDQFASDLRSAYKSWSIKYVGQIKQYYEEVKKAKIEKQKRLAAEAQAKFDNEIADIKKSVERLFKKKKGTLKVLATAVNIDEKRTIKMLEDGIELIIPKAEGVQSVNLEGNVLYQAKYKARSLIEEAVTRQRQKRMNTKFSWRDWRDATSFKGDERDLSLACLFKKSSDVPDKEVTVEVTLHSFNSSKSSVSILLKCGDFGWLDKINPF